MFDEFYGALSEYTEAVTDVLVQVTDNWQLHQGHAQQCRKLLKALEEAKNG